MGLKARMESRVSVDFNNFLLVNILLRHLIQTLFSLLYSINLISEIRHTDLLAHVKNGISVEIDSFLLINIFLE